MPRFIKRDVRRTLSFGGHPQPLTAKIEPISGVILAVMLLAACSQNHASRSSNASASPEPELCAQKGAKDSYTFGYELSREMHEAEDSNKRHDFRAGFILAVDARARVRRCLTIAGVVDSAVFDDFQADLDVIAAESLIGLHQPEEAGRDLRTADAVLDAGRNASDATDDTRKEAARLHQRVTKDLAELSH